MNNITRVQEFPALHAQIVRSQYAQQDLDKVFKRLLCKVDDIDWRPDNVMEAIVMKNRLFFEDDVILITLEKENSQKSSAFIRVSETEYKDIFYGNTTGIGSFMGDLWVPTDRKKFLKIRFMSDTIDLILFIVVTGIIVTIMYLMSK